MWVYVNGANDRDEQEHAIVQVNLGIGRAELQKLGTILKYILDADMWRYHANPMDARRSQFDLGRVDAYI